MSKLVDERVVEMRFDNSNFERNTRRSMDTIQKLKSSMNFGGVSDALEKSARSFSVWEVAGITAISNLTDRVVNFGVQMAKSLSVDNIAAGWDKFAEQTKNTGTIISQLSNTMDRDVASQLTSEYMEKLQYYSDMTSYSLNDMTSAISKFIGKGQEMDESFKASVGIANWAASAGKNAQEAQIAFNALSKVADHVLSRQWTSIQLGTMDTIEFKNAVLEAAVAEGTLTKSSERLDGTIEYMTKKGHQVTSENFAEYFSDEWFNTDVLMNVLGDYGYAVDKVIEKNAELGADYDAFESLAAYKKEMEDLKKEAIELGDAEKLAAADQALFSIKALEAASEARTLEDAINAVKDAVSTGWLTAFQKVIGEYEQATEFFSEFATVLTDIFTAPTKALNDSLKNWLSEGGRTDLFGGTITDAEGNVSEIHGAFWDITDTIKKFLGIISSAFKETFKFNKSLKQITESLRNFTEKTLVALGNHADDIKNIFKGIFSIFKLGIKIIKGIKIALQPIIDAIKGDSGNFIHFLGRVGEMFSKWVDETEIFNKVGSRFAKIFKVIIDTLKEIKLIERTKNAFKDMFKEMEIGGVLLDAWKSIVAALDSVFDVLLDCIKNIIVFTGKYIIPALAKVIKYLAVFAGILAGAVIKGITFLIDKIKQLFDYIKGSQPIQNAWKKFVDFMKSIPSRLKKLGPFFERLGKAIVNFFKAVWAGIKTLGQGIAQVFKFETIGDFFVTIGEKIAYGFKKIVEGIKSLANMDSDIDGVQKELTPLQVFFKGLIDLFKGIWAIIKALIPFIGRLLSSIGALFTTIGNSIDKTFTKTLPAGEGKGFSFGELLGGGIAILLGKTLYDIFYLFKGLTAGIYELFSGLGSLFRAKAAIMWATAIKSIALSILMLVGALLILSMMDTNALIKAGIALGALMITLTACLLVIAKFAKSSRKVTRSFGGIKGKSKGKMKIGNWNKSGAAGLYNSVSESTGLAGVGAMIIGFGLAILALTAALKIIDSIDSDKLGTDMLILISIMGALAVAVGVMNRLATIGSKARKGITGVKGLVGFAIAILIITAPIKKLGELPTEVVFKGVAAMAAISLAFGVMIRIMHGFKAKGISKMMVFAAAMLSLVTPIEILGSMETGKLISGVAALSAVAMAYGIMTLMGSKMKISSAIGFIATLTMFGFAINSIVELINSKDISNMDMASIGKFSLIFTSMIGAVVIVMNSLKKLSSAKKLKTSFAVFSVLLLEIAAIITGMVYLSRVLNGVEWDSIWIKLSGIVIISTLLVKGVQKIAQGLSTSKRFIKQLAIFGVVAEGMALVAMSFALVAKVLNEVDYGAVLLKLPVIIGIAIATVMAAVLLAKTLSTSKKFITQLAIFVVLMESLALVAMSFAVVAKTLNGVEWPAIAKMLSILVVSIVAAVAVIAIAVKFNKQINKVASSLIMLGGAFALFGAAAVLFAVAINLLSKNIKGLIVFAGLAVVLGVAMKLLGSAVPTMMLVAVAFGVMGAAALAIGAGFYLMVLALSELLPNLDALAEKGEALETVIAAMVQGVLEGFANALPTFIAKIMEAIDILVQNVIAKIMGIFDWIKKLNISDVMDVVKKLVDLAFETVMLVLTKLEENIGPILNKVINILLNAIDVLITRLPELIDKLVKLVLALIDGLGQAIEDNAAALRDTIIGFCEHLWNAFLNFFGIHSPSKKTEEAGKNIMLGIIEGIGKNLTKVVKEIMKVGVKMLKEISKLPKQFMKIGIDILKGFLDGLRSVVRAVLDFFKGLWEDIKEFFGWGNSKEEYKEVGKETMMQFKDGLEEGEMDVNDTAKKVVASVVDEIADKSTIFRLIGEEITKQIGFGIDMSDSVIAEALMNAINGVYDDIEQEYDDLDKDSIIEKYLDKLIGILESEMDEHQFVITPVVDLTDVKNATVAMAAMFGTVGNNTVYSASYSSAERAQSEINAAKQASTSDAVSSTENSIANQNGEVYNVTFNVTGPDTKSIVEEVDKLFSSYVTRRDTTWR